MECVLRVRIYSDHILLHMLLLIRFLNLDHILLHFAFIDPVLNFNVHLYRVYI